MTAALHTPPDAPLSAPPSASPSAPPSPLPTPRPSPRPHRPRVVVRAAPRREPPFDDELSVPIPPRGVLEQQLPFGVESSPRTWVPRSVIGGPDAQALPDPAAWGRRLVIGLIETSAGRRPLAQLTGMLSPSVNRGLSDSFERAAREGTSHWLHRASVRSVRAAEPVDGVAEVCATVETGRRVRALAFRLEECRGRWRCVRLQLG